MKEWFSQNAIKRQSAFYHRLCAWCLTLLALSGIATTYVVAQAPERSQPSTAQPLIQSTHLDAVQLTLTADRQTMGVADRLRLRLSVEAPVDTHITLPKVTDRLGAFTVLQHRSTGPTPVTSQTQQWQQEYRLEAEHAGELTIPSLTVVVQPATTAGDSALQHLATDPMRITVTSIVPDAADVTAPKDIAPPVGLRPRGLPAWVWMSLAGLAGLGLLGGGLWWYGHRRARASAPLPPRPAHLVALEALRRLQRQDLIAQQRVEEFYVRVSDIVRRYIEWRFGLRAPEQTTEEFLLAGLATGGLIATHRHLLEAFLAHCDLVKFARHQPTAEDMHQAWQGATAFVEQTADDQVMVAAAAPGVEAL